MNINDYYLRQLSSFVDGELSQKETRDLIYKMKENPNIKETYFQMIALKEDAAKLKSLGIKKRLFDFSFSNLLRFLANKVVMPISIFSVGVVLSYGIISTSLSDDRRENETTTLINDAISSSEARETLEMAQNEEIINYASMHYSDTNQTGVNILPVQYSPRWVPTGYQTARNSRNKFINTTNRKGFSIYISNPESSRLPDGVYMKENFVLIKKTHINKSARRTVTVFGDIDVESAQKVLNSIEVN
jgi:hypothetical protein